MQGSPTGGASKDTFLIFELACAANGIDTHHQYLSINQGLIQDGRHKTILKATQPLHTFALEWLGGHYFDGRIVFFQATSVPCDGTTGAETGDEYIYVGKVLDDLRCCSIVVSAGVC